MTDVQIDLPSAPAGHYWHIRPSYASQNHSIIALKKKRWWWVDEEVGAGLITPHSPGEIAGVIHRAAQDVLEVLERKSILKGLYGNYPPKKRSS